MNGLSTGHTNTHEGQQTYALDRVALIFKALGDIKRLEILHHLMQKPRSVSELADLLALEVANLSYHLKVLRSAGVVRARPAGQRRVYHLVGRSRLGTLYLKLDGGVQIKLPLASIATDD